MERKKGEGYKEKNRRNAETANIFYDCFPISLSLELILNCCGHKKIFFFADIVSFAIQLKNYINYNKIHWQMISSTEKVSLLIGNTLGTLFARKTFFR